MMSADIEAGPPQSPCYTRRSVSTLQIIRLRPCASLSRMNIESWVALGAMAFFLYCVLSVRLSLESMDKHTEDISHSLKALLEEIKSSQFRQ